MTEGKNRWTTNQQWLICERARDWMKIFHYLMTKGLIKYKIVDCLASFSVMKANLVKQIAFCYVKSLK